MRLVKGDKSIDLINPNHIAAFLSDGWEEAKEQAEKPASSTSGRKSQKK